MRKIGELPDANQAGLFSRALYAQGLENDVETEDHGAFAIWVHDDDQLAKGRELLAQFAANPAAPEWATAAAGAAGKMKEEERAVAHSNSNVMTQERIEYERHHRGFAWVPLILTILSIMATFWAGERDLMPGNKSRPADVEEEFAAKEREQRREKIYITQVQTVFADALKNSTIDAEGNLVLKDPAHFHYSLSEIRSGEIWRLFTPIFLHFGILHILFNILWLRDLGGFMQHRFGAFYLLVFILTVAAVSNLTQLAVGGPQFGGLSGVNYGLLGFLWLRGKFDRGGIWQLNPQVVQAMIVWLVLCLFLPGVANGAHVAGLLFGMLTGYTTAMMANARRRHA